MLLLGSSQNGSLTAFEQVGRQHRLALGRRHVRHTAQYRLPLLVGNGYRGVKKIGCTRMPTRLCAGLAFKPADRKIPDAGG
jgi:hypothetical protein